MSRDYIELGKRWLNKEVEFVDFDSGDGVFSFNPKQIEFLNAQEKYVLFNGGMGAGKTLPFLVKLWLTCVMFPNSHILLGRKTRQSVEQVTIPDLRKIWPAGSYEYRVGPGQLSFPNGSMVTIMGLDALQDGSGDIKKAEQKIKSMNLSGVYIDQLEEIEKRVIDALGFRLRSMEVPLRQMNFTANPANYWAYDYFKANPKPGTRLIETGMEDNAAHLPADFIEDAKSKGEMYWKRYGEGIWDPKYLVEDTVFPEEHVNGQTAYNSEPIRSFDGIDIYKEPDNHKYQIGIDPSIGSVDPSYVYVLDTDTGEQVARYTGRVNTEALMNRILVLCNMYHRPLVVPEVTGIGQGLIELLKRNYGNIYIREKKLTDGYALDQETSKLGFYTNHATKTELIEHMKTLFAKKFPRIADSQVVDELRTFVYTDAAKGKGASAQGGYHDDGVMAMMLAHYKVKAKTFRDKIKNDSPVSRMLDRKERLDMVKYNYE